MWAHENLVLPDRSDPPGFAAMSRVPSPLSLSPPGRGRPVGSFAREVGKLRACPLSLPPLVSWRPPGTRDFTGRLKTNTIKVIGIERRVERVAVVVTAELRLVDISVPQPVSIAESRA